MTQPKPENGTRELYAWAFRFTLGLVVTILTGLSFNIWIIIRDIEESLNKAVNTLTLHEHRISILETNDKIHGSTLQGVVNDMSSIRERIIRLEDIERKRKVP